MSARVGLTTPGGTVGSHTLRLVAHTEQPVTVVARDPWRSLPADLPDHVQVAVADLTDCGAFTAAVEGVDTLLCVIPENPTDDPEGEYRLIADVYADAVAAAGIRRVVLQSSVGTEHDGGGGELRGLRHAERVLAGTGVALRVVRCGYFTTNLTPLVPTIRDRGVVPTSMDLDRPMPWVDPRDVAAVQAGLLLASGWGGQEVRGVHGPADLSWRDVARVLSGVVGRRVEAVQVGDDELRAGLLESGLPAGSADSIVETAALMRRGLRVDPPRSVLSTTPTSLREWASVAFAAAEAVAR